MEEKLNVFPSPSSHKYVYKELRRLSKMNLDMDTRFQFDTLSLFIYMHVLFSSYLYLYLLDNKTCTGSSLNTISIREVQEMSRTLELRRLSFLSYKI